MGVSSENVYKRVAEGVVERVGRVTLPGGLRKAIKEKERRERMDTQELQPITANTRACMDGRPTLGRYILRADGSVTVLSGKETSAKVVEAALPGADLGFVATLVQDEVMGAKKFNNEEAMRVVSKVLRGMDKQPQFHVDNHHGEMELPSDEQGLKDKLREITDGCGFAGLVWGENAGNVIQMAKNSEWSIQVLDGNHGEGAAHRIEKPGMGINNAVTSSNEAQKFRFNVAETKEILKAIEAAINIPGYADKAFAWFDGMFSLIANKLSKGAIKEVTKVA